MKKILFLIVTFFSLFCLGQSVNASYVVEVKKDAGYISLSASSEKEVSPNVARIIFAVENTEEDAQKATQDNNVISNKIMDSLKLIATETDIIKTSNFSVNPVYSKTPSGKRVIKNYTVSNSVEVETKNIVNISKYINTAINSGANRVNGLSYQLTDGKKMCDELYPELLSDLRNQASLLAKAAGTSIDGLKHLNATCNHNTIVSNGRFYAKAASGMDSVVEESAMSTPVEAGKIKVRVYVNADFYVK